MFPLVITSATEVHHRRSELVIISTGSKELDKLLGSIGSNYEYFYYLSFKQDDCFFL